MFTITSKTGKLDFLPLSLLIENPIFLNHGKVFGGYWKEVHRVENVYVNLALHSIREMAALTRLRIFNIKMERKKTIDTQ